MVRTLNQPDLVSVIVPIYNAALYIDDSIKSVLNQSYPNIEVIAIDDCSTDSTYEILERYSDKRLRLYKNTSKLGVSETLNRGVSLARGFYIARHDADDISLYNRIDIQVKFLKASNYDLVGCNLRRFGTKSDIVRFPTNYTRIFIRLFYGSPLAHPTVVGKASVFKQHNYDARMEYAEDYDLWERLDRYGFKITNINEVLVNYRVHDNQVSNLKSVIQNRSKESISSRRLNLFFNRSYGLRKAIEHKDVKFRWIDIVYWLILEIKNHKRLKVIIKILGLF